MTAEEEDLEIQLDKERYQSLDTDITEDELQRGGCVIIINYNKDLDLLYCRNGDEARSI